jgi:hypothetical protein
MITPDFGKPLTAMSAAYYGEATGIKAALLRRKDMRCAWDIWGALACSLPNCEPGKALVRGRCGLSASTVKRGLRIAERIGLITVERRPLCPKVHDTNRYTLRDIRQPDAAAEVIRHIEAFPLPTRTKVVQVGPATALGGAADDPTVGPPVTPKVQKL